MVSCSHAGAYLTLSWVWNIPRRSRGKSFCSHVEEDVHKSNQVFTWWTSCSPGEHCDILLKTVPYPSVTSFFSIFSPEFRGSLFHRCFLRLGRWGTLWKSQDEEHFGNPKLWWSCSQFKWNSSWCSTQKCNTQKKSQLTYPHSASHSLSFMIFLTCCPV